MFNCWAPDTGNRAVLARYGTAEQKEQQARLVTLKAAYMMDTVGNKAARTEIAMIKVLAPNAVLRVLDRAIQAQGGTGLSQDTFLEAAWAGARTLRLADGPDEVHNEAIAKQDLREWPTRVSQSASPCSSCAQLSE